MSRETILSVSELTVGYGEKAAVSQVSFSLYRGEILCLVGERVRQEHAAQVDHGNDAWPACPFRLD